VPTLLSVVAGVHHDALDALVHGLERVLDRLLVDDDGRGLVAEDAESVSASGIRGTNETVTGNDRFRPTKCGLSFSNLVKSEMRAGCPALSMYAEEIRLST